MESSESESDSYSRSSLVNNTVPIVDEFIAPSGNGDESEVNLLQLQQIATDKEKLSTIINHDYDTAKIEDNSWVEDTLVSDLTWNDIKEGRVKPSVNAGRRWNRIRTSYVSIITILLTSLLILYLLFLVLKLNFAR